VGGFSTDNPSRFAGTSSFQLLHLAASRKEIFPHQADSDNLLKPGFSWRTLSDQCVSSWVLITGTSIHLGHSICVTRNCERFRMLDSSFNCGDFTAELAILQEI